MTAPTTFPPPEGALLEEIVSKMKCLDEQVRTEGLAAFEECQRTGIPPDQSFGKRLAGLQLEYRELQEMQQRTWDACMMRWIRDQRARWGIPDAR